MNTDHSDVFQGNILVVDDTPANLRLLAEMLTDRGYTVRPVPNGKLALWGARGKTPPDLILLDIMMPDMDGYEVCQQLKADERTRDIPVIFLSALDDVLDKIKAFSVGGVDYITKPFEDQEVLARVETHLELKHAREKLQQQNRELIEAARLREDVERITRHDLKTPLNSIIGFPQVMMRDGNLTAKQSEYLKIIKNAGLTMLNMINLSLDMFKMESGTYKFKPVPVNVLPTIRRIINDTETIQMTKKLSAAILIDGKPADNEASFSVQGEELLCYSMLANLIKNAFEASPQEERITVELAEEKEMSVIRIHNKGTVPEDIRDRFFDKYVTSDKESGTGLGTYSARLTAETQRGKIHLDTSEAKGTVVTIRLLSLTPEMRSAARTAMSVPPSASPAKSDKKEHALDSDKLKALPKEQIEALKTAATRTDLKGANAVIGRIREFDKPLADALSELVSMYRYDIIQELLEKLDETRPGRYPQPDDLAAISDEWRIALHDASIIGDSDKCLELIEQIPSEHSESARELKRSVQEFDFEKLAALSGKKGWGSVSDVTLQNDRKAKDPDTLENKNDIPVDSVIFDKADLFAELIRILKTEFLPRQEELNDMLIMDDASQFADDLGHVGREYDLRLITDFCDNLLDDIEIFDVMRVKKRIAEFPGIIEKLERFRDKGSDNKR